MTDIGAGKKILVLDFDGVCHSYTSAWINAETIPDLPVPGLFEFLEQVLWHFQVDIYSSRSKSLEARNAMREWFLRHAETYYANNIGLNATAGDIYDWEGVANAARTIVDQLKFPVAKPAAFITLDDRAITFTGHWPDIEQLTSFKPWNEHLKVKK